MLCLSEKLCSTKIGKEHVITKFARSLPDEIKTMCQLLMGKNEAMMPKGFIYSFQQHLFLGSSPEQQCHKYLEGASTQWLHLLLRMQSHTQKHDITYSEAAVF